MSEPMLPIFSGWGGECRTEQKIPDLGTSNVTQVILNLQPT